MASKIELSEIPVYQHPQTKVVLGHVDVNHEAADRLIVFCDGVQIKNCVEARDGNPGWVIYRPVMSSVTRELEGVVHFELQANSGFTEEEVREMQDPRNNHVVDKLKIRQVKPNDIAAYLQPRTRRITRDQL